MSKDSGQLDRIYRFRTALGNVRGITEIRMFGGLCFTVHGNMAWASRLDEPLGGRKGSPTCCGYYPPFTCGSSARKAAHRVVTEF
jgi:hypothetical protein